MVVHKLPEKAVPFAQCPRKPLNEIRAEERKIARLKRAAETRIQTIRRELDEQCRPHVDRQMDVFEGVQDRYDLPAGCMVHTESGAIVYDAGQGQSREVPSDLPKLDKPEDASTLKSVPEE